MTDEKKNIPGTAPLDDSVPAETPALLQRDLGLDRRGTVPSFDPQRTTPATPGPFAAKLPLGGPEFAPTVISPRRDAAVPEPHPSLPAPVPATSPFAKTVASATNPVLAKMEAAERDYAQRVAAEQKLAERVAAERKATERLVADRSRPPVPSGAIATPVAPPPSAAQSLRQSLGSRPISPADMVTDPLTGPRVAAALAAPARPTSSGLKTDPLQTPDVAGAMARAAAQPPGLSPRIHPDATQVMRPSAEPPIQADPTRLTRAPAPEPITTPVSAVPRGTGITADPTSSMRAPGLSPAPHADATNVVRGPGLSPAPHADATNVVRNPGLSPAPHADATNVVRTPGVTGQSPHEGTNAMWGPTDPAKVPTAPAGQPSVPAAPAAPRLPPLAIPPPPPRTSSVAIPPPPPRSAANPGPAEPSAPLRAQSLAAARPVAAPAPAVAAPRAAAPAPAQPPPATRPPAGPPAALPPVAARPMISPIVQPLPGPPRPIPAQTVAAGPKGVGLQNSRPPEPPGVPLPTSLRGSDTGDDAGEPLPTRPDHPQPQGVLTQAAPARLPNAVQVTATPASPVSQREVALAPAALTPPRPRPGEPEPAFNPMQPVTMPNRRQIPYEDLPPAMEAPKPLGPEFFRTQPGVPGPSTRGRAPATLEARPDDIATRERAPHQPGRGEAGSTAQVLDAVTTEDGEAPPAVTSDQVLASVAPVWRRSFSWLLDLLVIGGLSGGLLSLAATFLGGKPAPPSLHGFAALLFQLKPIAIPGAAAAVGMAFLYTLFFGVLLQGRTVGRLVLGIRLVDATGHAPGVGRAFVRAVFALISFALFLSGFWLSLFDRRGQTLHDKLTRTFVIRPV